MSPDETVVATSSDQIPVDLWDVATGEHLLALRPEAGNYVTDLDWSADGELLAIALADDVGGSIVVVDRSGAVQAELREDEDVYIQSVSFNPAGDRLATTRDPYRDDPSKRGVQIWDWERGEVVRTLGIATIDAVFAPTSDRVVAIGELEGIATVWDAATGDEVATLPQSDASIYDVAFSGDGRRLATTGADGTIRLWDAATGEEELVLRGHDVPNRTVTFSPDGSRLAAIDYTGVVRVWALELDDLVDHRHRAADPHAHRRRVRPVPPRGDLPRGLRCACAGPDGVATDLPRRRRPPATAPSEGSGRAAAHRSPTRRSRHGRHRRAGPGGGSDHTGADPAVEREERRGPRLARRGPGRGRGGPGRRPGRDLGGDPEVTTGIQSPGLIDNGSITAIDHAAETAPGQSPGLVENGSITAVDQAAAGGSAPTAACRFLGWEPRPDHREREHHRRRPRRGTHRPVRP